MKNINKVSIKKSKSLLSHRKASEKTSITNLTNEQWENCKKHFDYTCAYCGKKPNVLCKDHFIPLTLGGGLTVNNVVPCCQNCNSSKSNRKFNLWYRSTSFYSLKRETKILNYLNSFKE